MGNQQLGPKAQRRPPNEIEKELLEDLQRRAQSSVTDKENEQIVNDLLKRFWNTVQGEEKEFKRKGKAWQGMGFQGEDPLTDFRAGGLLALENIVFFVEKYTGLATSMIKRREMKMSEDGSFMQNYPWSAAGVNVTHTSMAIFGLSATGKNNPSKALGQKMKRYWELAIYFSEVYCVAFKLLDDKYTEMKATYLSFNKVLEASKEELNGLLKHTGVQDIFKTEQYPLKLFITERRKSTSFSDLNMHTRSRSISPQNSMKDIAIPGDSSRPSPEMIRNMLLIHTSIVEGCRLVATTESKAKRGSKPEIGIEIDGTSSIDKGTSGAQSLSGTPDVQSLSGFLEKYQTPKEEKLLSMKDSSIKAQKIVVDTIAEEEGEGVEEEAPKSGESELKDPMPCRVAQILFDFKATEEGDLELTEGDHVIITSSSDSGWWQGEGKHGEGRFPANYVKEYHTPWFSALAAYIASTPSELSLKEGDIIKLREVDSSGWWKGSKRASGEKGWFPAAFVEPIKDRSILPKETKETPGPPDKKNGTSARRSARLSLSEGAIAMPMRHGRAGTLAEFGCDEGAE
eukprot:CAMPEP_0184496138 /NCGR_PEP_ID=MMETSP0113_2-20130426/33206_1 /TAXON_ID=91329 /ORGANISM="Norrisiella sphaerica, Strain BC52" /LENGTH=568 /DNA_ID=CAMNT_0026882649 /DNA_START=58 /DNA_END=1764 /DNA_ORIENTATION=-